MFAKRWKQNRDILLKFEEISSFKQKKENFTTIKDIRKKTLGISWFMEPAIENNLNEGNFKKKISGNAGEYSVDQALWFWLPPSYNIFHSVVLNPVNKLFIQMDHLVVSNHGIFIIETKHWKGFIEGDNENWKKTTRYKGLEIMKNNPYKEQIFHDKMFKMWCKYNLRDIYDKINTNIFPFIVFIGAEGLRTNCSIPVFNGTKSALWYILKTGQKNIFSNEEIFYICKNIQEAKFL